MKLDHALIAYMLFVGAAAGVILTMRPEWREFRTPPYFWVLIAMALFEGVNFARGGVMPSMAGRLFGFAAGIILMIAIPMLATAFAARA